MPSGTPELKATRQPRCWPKRRGERKAEETTEPRMMPAQKVALIQRSTRPRSRAGTSSSTAELMAAYSPPMPAPVRTRKRVKLARFQERPVAAVAQR